MCHVLTCPSEGWLRVSWDQAAIYLWSHLDGDFKNVLSCELSGFPPSYGFQGLNSVNLAGQTLLSTELKRDFLWEPGLSPSELQACAFGSLDFFRFSKEDIEMSATTAFQPGTREILLEGTGASERMSLTDSSVRPFDPLSHLRSVKGL